MDKLRFLVAVFAAAAFGGCVDDMGMRVAHAPRTLAPSPVVALPDTGVDDSHPELRGRVVFPAGHAELLADLHLRCGGLRGVVLVTKTLEDALRRVPLLRIAVAAIVLKPLLDQRGKLVEQKWTPRIGQCGK